MAGKASMNEEMESRIAEDTTSCVKVIAVLDMSQSNKMGDETSGCEAALRSGRSAITHCTILRVSAPRESLT
eukprot:CAMPEP_0195027518 /NCGR_PEP_ID=MMETSP0326_2-20130528/52429_1 /TAXON_ID=2866 ORGANISM="Crypthecodinium cohnii, Strain Seligo" /NCGR_SAMPLE_ID=MMETSP0326_2 /ASSEMBLY_ACC=CAM_ASM_000348 /LENGTH=71 /DNA_ID=CAMNT_0040049717 /DNA_START=198 /DNA_END=413 /DNA_ORIENTATION=+